MKRIILAAATAAALVAPNVAAAPKNNQGNLSLAAAKSVIVWGNSTTVAGKLTGTNNRAGQAIDLQALRFPYTGGFQTVATATSATDGSYAFTVRPRVNSRYRVKYKSSLSNEVPIGVRLRVTRKVSDATPAKGQRVRFSGTVSPEHDGRALAVQRRSVTTGKWYTVAKTITRNVEGEGYSSYSRRVTIKRNGTFRITVRSADGDHLTGVSRRVRLVVH